MLRERITQLEARLAQYESAHTSPSLRCGGNHEKGRNEGDKGTPGQKTGYKGLTRPYVKPDKEVEVTADRCPACGTKLGSPFRIESKFKARSTESGYLLHLQRLLS